MISTGATGQSEEEKKAASYSGHQPNAAQGTKMTYPVAVYARVSTSDKDQNPETQLIPVRDHCRVQGWEVFRQYVDMAPAQDVVHRTAWRALLDDAAKRRFKAVVVFKLDRAFRSVKHMHDTLAAWEPVGVDFKSIREGFDTSTALGRLLMNLLASLAEFELEIISERVRAGCGPARGAWSWS